MDAVALVAEAALGRDRPAVVAVAGGVAAGKTTFAAAVVSRLTAAGREAVSVATDGFLLSNAQLSERGLMMRKGFPESYDDARLAAVVGDLRSGVPAEVPLYDHAAYDVGGTVAVGPADVVVVEGVNALSSDGLRRHVDVGVYLDVDEPVLVEWYRHRLLALLADPPPGSFYAAIAPMSVSEAVAFADDVWVAVNAPNLRDHIEPSREWADVVVRLDADHGVVEIERQRR